MRDPISKQSADKHGGQNLRNSSWIVLYSTYKCPPASAHTGTREWEHKCEKEHTHLHTPER